MVGTILFCLISVLRMRFQRNGSAEKKNFCRDFRVKENNKLLVDPTLFYDCLWSNNEFNDYESSTYNLEVMVKKHNQVAYKKFAFTVPSHTRLCMYYAIITVQYITVHIFYFFFN